MTERSALTVSVGVLAGISCLLTAYVVPVPIWILFIAWASFFAAGGGGAGFAQSLVMTLVGVVSATLTLLLIAAGGGSGWVVAAFVVVGAGVLVAIGRYKALAFTPAGFFGFASTVSAVAATGKPITEQVSIGHPVVVTVVALVLGAIFGIVSERFARIMTKTAPALPVKSGSPAMTGSEGTAV